jgi:fermentation-respiration switch protein FrsA (DUF1100 family)
LHVPLLILHSRSDDLIPFHHAERNFAAANQPKFLCEMTGGHNDGLWSSRPAMLVALKDFLPKPLEGKGGTERPVQ